jgi:transcriptional regulator with XRE-family HTH domain
VPTLHDVLANAVRAERSRRRWTQAELAQRLGWPRTRVHDVELGRSKLELDDLAGLCRAFGVPLSELARGGDDEDLVILGLR